MATVSGFKAQVLVRGAESRITPPPNGAVASVDGDLSRQWPAGSGSGTVNTVYDVVGSATSSPTVIDLSALPSMTGGSARNVIRLMFLVIENTGSTNVLTVGGGTTPVFANARTIQPGGVETIAFAASGADGLNVSTNKLLSIESASGTTYRIRIAGRTA